MASMSEGNSPWHRENTIGIHTDMVVSHYLANSPNEWDKQEVLGAFACAFHDVGKPRASEINGIKFKPEINDDTYPFKTHLPKFKNAHASLMRICIRPLTWALAWRWL